MAAKIEVCRTHAASGEPSPLTTAQEVVPEKRGQTMPDAIMNLIRPFHPSRTLESCVYSFDSPEHGRGTIIVTMQGVLYRDRMDEKVQMLELERVLGRREPGKISDTMAWMYAVRVQIRNPYTQIVFGLLIMIAGGMQIAFLQPDLDSFNRIGLAVVGTVAALLGFFLLVLRGVRRIGWWHRARAVVKRSGDKMPEDLQLFP